MTGESFRFLAAHPPWEAFEIRAGERGGTFDVALPRADDGAEERDVLDAWILRMLGGELPPEPFRLGVAARSKGAHSASELIQRRIRRGRRRANDRRRRLIDR